MKKALGKRVRLESPPPGEQVKMAEVNALYRPPQPLVIGSELRRPSTPALPAAMELPSHGNLHQRYPRMTDVGPFVQGNFPERYPAPTQARAPGDEELDPGRREEENNYQDRRRLLLPRWLIRPCVSTDRLYQPPTPSAADGNAELVLVDIVCGQIVRAHESCEDARNPNGPKRCTSCALYCVTNANVSLPM